MDCPRPNCHLSAWRLRRASGGPHATRRQPSRSTRPIASAAASDRRKPQPRSTAGASRNWRRQFHAEESVCLSALGKRVRTDCRDAKLHMLNMRETPVNRAGASREGNYREEKTADMRLPRGTCGTARRLTPKVRRGRL
jgi:hypothetical protein